MEWFKVQGSLLFVTYTIIQGIIGSEMLVIVSGQVVSSSLVVV